MTTNFYKIGAIHQFLAPIFYATGIIFLIIVEMARFDEILGA